MMEPIEIEPRSRFGVRHIMLWTLGSGVQVAISNWFYANSLFGIREHSLFTQFQIGFGAICIGSVFAAFMGMLEAKFVRRQPLLQFPGHWIVMNLSLICGWSILSQLIAKSFLGNIDSALKVNALSAIICLGHIFTTTGYFVAAFAKNNQGWLALFCSIALIEFCGFLLTAFVPYWLRSNMQIGLNLITFAVCLLFVRKSWLESRAGARYDWIHHMGVYCMLLFVAVQTVYFLIYLAAALRLYLPLF